MAFPSDEPAWENNGTEVSEEQEPTLLSRLDLQRVEMHVELWTNIRIEHGVDVLEMHFPGLLVPSVWERVWLVEATTSSSAQCGVGHASMSQASC